ncbi:MAG: DUF5752 family protein [Candidatus Omnitrophota bacterium]
MISKEPFRFYTRLHLSELTGLKASNLPQLLELIKEVPGASIYHHTHRFLQQHIYLSPEPPNDFAYWVNEILQEKELGERLASIDTIMFSNIRSLRDQVALTIEDYIKENPLSKLKFAKQDQEFYFIKTISFVIPTNYTVSSLDEFIAILKKVTIDSIYFHIFESRLRLEKQTNDFSYWIETSLNNKKLAGRISNIDPYTQTLEDLRNNLINIIESEVVS